MEIEKEKEKNIYLQMRRFKGCNEKCQHCKGEAMF